MSTIKIRRVGLHTLAKRMQERLLYLLLLLLLLILVLFLILLFIFLFLCEPLVNPPSKG